MMTLDKVQDIVASPSIRHSKLAGRISKSLHKRRASDTATKGKPSLRKRRASDVNSADRRSMGSDEAPKDGQKGVDVNSLAVDSDELDSVTLSERMRGISDGQCQPSYEDMELVENVSWHTESDKSDEERNGGGVSAFEKRYSDMGDGPYLNLAADALAHRGVHENMQGLLDL